METDRGKDQRHIVAYAAVAYEAKCAKEPALARDSRARSEGSQRTRDHGSYQSSGGGRSSGRSYGPSGGSRGGGGGRRR